MILNSTEVNRFSKVFIQERNYKSKEDSKSVILNKIAKFELKSCNENFSIEDFKKHLFYSESFHKSSAELKTALKTSDYIYIHSYGKNGKSTFIKLFIDSIDDQSSLFFDFRAKKKNIPKIVLREKIDTFYEYFLFKFQSFKTHEHPFILFSKYIIANYNHEQILKIEDPEIGLSSIMMLKLSKTIINNLEEITINRQGKHEIDSSELKSLIFNFFKNDVDKLFAILLAIQVYYEIKVLNKTDIYIAFDNLDDVYTYLPEELNNSYTSYVIEFFESLKIIFPEIFLNDKSTFNITPKFIFMYRTSNYLSTLSSMYNVSDSIKSRIDLFDENLIERVRLTSVKDSPSILNQRLDLYQGLCDAWGIQKSVKYDLLRNILKAFDEIDKTKTETYAPSTILRLWNGNKLAFVDFVLSVNIHENDLNALLEKKISSRLKTEIFFHNFIKHFHKKTDNKTPLTNFIDYTFKTFNNDLNDKRCGLARLFFTYVFNKRIADSKVESVEDAFKKGVPLSDFLNDLKEININGSTCYSEEDIKNLFDCLFGFEIDNWGNFFSCCTPTTENNSIEQYKWVEDVLDAIHDPEKAEMIKFYNNDSAGYFMFQLRRSFEYFSYSTNKGVKTLSNSIYYQVINKKTIQFVFDKILLDVFKRVKEVCEITFNFFKEAFKDTTVHDYCNSVWAMNKRMYFDDLISRIIEYIENIRFAVINEQLMIHGSYSELTIDEKKNVRIEMNKVFIKNIIQYLNLFFTLYDECKERDGIIRVKSSDSFLYRTHFSFIHMKKIAEQLLDDPDDFSQRISTPDNPK